MSKNVVHATGVKGIYKDKHIEIHIGEHSKGCKLIVNDEEITNCTGMWIKMIPGQQTKLYLELVKQNE